MNMNMDIFHLSQPQKRIWFIENIYANTPINCIGGVVYINTLVDVDILRRSISEIIRNNIIFNLKFVEKEGDVYQFVQSNLKNITIPHKTYASKKQFNANIKQIIQTPFNLFGNKLFEFFTFSINGQNGIFAKIHHIIADGWTFDLILKQIFEYYFKISSNTEITRTSNSYIDFLEKEQEYLKSDKAQKDKMFWMESLKNVPFIPQHTTTHVPQGKRVSYELNNEMNNRINEYLKKNNVSIYTLFLLCLSLYHKKAYGIEDLVLGLPIYNRFGKEKSILGMCTSTMPFRIIYNDQLIDSSLKTINRELRNHYAHQKYPYNMIICDLELNDKYLFNLSLNYYNVNNSIDDKTIPIKIEEFYSGCQFYPLQIIIRHYIDTGNIQLDFDYRLDLFDASSIKRLYQNIISILKQITYYEVTTTKQIAIHEEDLYFEKIQNNIYPDKSIHKLIEEQSMNTPNNIAINHMKHSITYKELNAKANLLASWLHEYNITQEEVIGIYADHSIETIITVLGILKAGGAFLFIDKKYPFDRVLFMLKDANVRLLFMDANQDNIPANIKCMDIKESYIGFLSIKKELPLISGSSLAYVLYTSGSTGKPKGVQIEHRSLVNYALWASKTYFNEKKEVIALYSSLSSDMTLTSIFVPLLCGQTIEIYDEESQQNEYAIYRILRDNRVTIIKLTPSQLSLLLDQDLPKSNIRKLIIGGENLITELAKKIYDKFNGEIAIYNEYGPTETVVGCMIHLYNPDIDKGVSVPIGSSIDNMQIYVLDQQLYPVKYNMTGEIYITGAGLSRGYLNQNELTKQVFIPSPFNKNSKMYKTGDIARVLHSGKLEFIGRNDRQIKINGYRIELSEIENTILSFPGINNAIAHVWNSINKTKSICIYFTTSVPDFSHNKLEQYLLDILPKYMVPKIYIKLDTMPMNSSGKIDIQKLPYPFTIENKKVQKIDVDKNLKVLTDVISSVLSIDIKTDDNFYYLGGDSIKAIQISSKINEYGIKLSVKDILFNPIISEMAQKITSGNQLLANQDVVEGVINKSPIFQWFLDMKPQFPASYYHGIILNISYKICNKDLEEIFYTLIKHHDALRINYLSKSDQFIYNNKHIESNFKIHEYDLMNMNDMQKNEFINLKVNETAKSFDIETGLLFKVIIFKTSKKERKILMIAHHILVDGVSWSILIEDINTMIEQHKHQKSYTLPFKTTSYKEWSLSLKQYSILKSEMKYWNTINEKIKCHSSSLLQRLTQLNKSSDDKIETIIKDIIGSYSERLIDSMKHQYRTLPEELLVTALLRTIYIMTDKLDLILEMESHGRHNDIDSIDVSRTVGWFTCIYPQYFYWGYNQLSDQIKYVKEQLRNIPNKGIGYGIMRYIEKNIISDNLVPIKFNYLGTVRETENLFIQTDIENILFSPMYPLSNQIDITCCISNNSIKIWLTYNAVEITNNIVQEFVDNFTHEIKTIIDFSCNTVDKYIFTPSDFNTLNMDQDDLDLIENYDIKR